MFNAHCGNAIGSIAINIHDMSREISGKKRPMLLREIICMISDRIYYKRL